MLCFILVKIPLSTGFQMCGQLYLIEVTYSSSDPYKDFLTLTHV